MSDARGDEKELDVLESGEGEGVDGLDRVVIDHHHRDVLRPSEGVSRQGVDSGRGRSTPSSQGLTPFEGVAYLPTGGEVRGLLLGKLTLPTGGEDPPFFLGM